MHAGTILRNLKRELRESVGIAWRAFVHPDTLPTGSSITTADRWRTAGVILAGTTLMHLALRVFALRFGLFFDPILSFELARAGVATGVLLAFVGGLAEAVTFGLLAGWAGVLSGGLLVWPLVGQFAVTMGAGFGGSWSARLTDPNVHSGIRQAILGALIVGGAFGVGAALTVYFQRMAEPLDNLMRLAAYYGARQFVIAGGGFGGSLLLTFIPLSLIRLSTLNGSR